MNIEYDPQCPLCIRLWLINTLLPPSLIQTPFYTLYSLNTPFFTSSYILISLFFFFFLFFILNKMPPRSSGPGFSHGAKFLHLLSMVPDTTLLIFPWTVLALSLLSLFFLPFSHYVSDSANITWLFLTLQVQRYEVASLASFMSL